MKSDFFKTGSGIILNFGCVQLVHILNNAPEYIVEFILTSDSKIEEYFDSLAEAESEVNRFFEESKGA